MKSLLSIFLLLISCTVLGKTKVVTTLPEFKWVVDELGKGYTESVSLLSGHEDPHFIDAVPSFILKVSTADLLVFNGMQLEMGWLPKVIQMAGNKKINTGQSGECDASKNIDKKQVIKEFNRSMGDIHPAGNPHYSLSVMQMQVVARTIKNCLVKVDPAHQDFFNKNLKALLKKLKGLETALKKRSEDFKSLRFMSYHLEFVYLFSDFNLKSFGTLEKVPGILPSGRQLFDIAKKAKDKKVNLILAGKTNPEKYLKKFQEITNIPYITIDLHMTDKYQDYITFQHSIFNEIAKHALKK